MAIKTRINLSDVNAPEAGMAVGSLVHVSGPTKAQQDDVDMVGYLAGVTYTHSNIIVYMEHGQSTTFMLQSEGLGVMLEVLPDPQLTRG